MDDGLEVTALAVSGTEDSSPSDAVYEVILDDAQYELLSQSLRYCVSFSLFSLLVSCAVLGSVVFGYFVRGWRNG